MTKLILCCKQITRFQTVNKILLGVCSEKTDIRAHALKTCRNNHTRKLLLIDGFECFDDDGVLVV